MTLLQPAICGVDKQVHYPGEKVLRHFSFALHSEQHKINTSFFIKIMLEFSVKCPSVSLCLKKKKQRSHLVEMRSSVSNPPRCSTVKGVIPL